MAKDNTMKNFPFIGRKYELSLLESLLHKKVASLAVIKGRRRIGKSRLIEEFGSGKQFYYFSGLAPVKGTTAQSQRNEFAIQLNNQTGLPEVQADDWSKLFLLLAEKTKNGRVILCFDEISWMGHKDPNFLGKLKNAWDVYFKKNPKLIFILCGSVSSWIEKNILSSTSFFGRISLKISLKELPLPDCNDLLEYIGFKRSALEKFMILSVTGGIPWYIEQVDPSYSALDNIKRLCFTKDGLLVDEFKYVFSDLFGRRSAICKKIVELLAKGQMEYTEITEALEYYSGGALSDYLNELVVSDFISQDTSWSLKTGADLRLNQYRLRDNYLRFYLKYIAPKLNKIKKDQFSNLPSVALPAWESILGLQFENLVLNNRQLVQQELALKPEDILADNPFFQRKTNKQKGCQIDYLIQTRFNTLFLCEIKFSKNVLTASVIEDVKEKIKRMALPRGFSCIPVLIHVSSVTDEVIESDYFSKIINFVDLLHQS